MRCLPLTLLPLFLVACERQPNGSIGTPTLFDAMAGKRLARKLRLISISGIKGDLVWLRYKM